MVLATLLLSCGNNLDLSAFDSSLSDASYDVMKTSAEEWEADSEFRVACNAAVGIYTHWLEGDLFPGRTRRVMRGTTEIGDIDVTCYIQHVGEGGSHGALEVVAVDPSPEKVREKLGWMEMPDGFTCKSVMKEYDLMSDLDHTGAILQVSNVMNVKTGSDPYISPGDADTLVEQCRHSY